MAAALETEAAYQRRKLRELAFLDSMFVPSGGRGGSVALPLQERKRHLARQLRALMAMDANCFSESRADGSREVAIGRFRMKWSYQRFDLRIVGPSVYGDLAMLGGGAFHHTWYTNSGMAAISGVLQALNSTHKGGLEIPHVCDAYYETQRYISQLCPNLTPVALSYPIMNKRRKHAVARGGTPAALLIDSIGIRSHEALLDLVNAENLGIVLIDTTCYPGKLPWLTGLVQRAINTLKPVVLLRSHIKLDALGLEYARLGSATFLLSLRAPRRQLDYFQELMTRTRLSFAAGGLAHASNLFPGAGDPCFEELNDQRIRRIRAANRRIEKVLLADGGGRKLSVRGYHHGLFTTLRVPGVLDMEAARACATELVNALQRQGVPAESRGSFGLDVTAVDTYLDLTDCTAPMVPTVRVALTDLPASLVERCAEVVRCSKFLR